MMKKCIGRVLFIFTLCLLVQSCGFFDRDDELGQEDYNDSEMSFELEVPEEENLLEENFNDGIVENLDEEVVEDTGDIEDINDNLEQETYETTDDHVFELPINGATGFAPVFMPVRVDGHMNSEVIFNLYPGDGFTIIQEAGEWWNIEVEGVTGWVEHAYCFINLPDVIPSIVYKNTNTFSSVFRSSGIEIPNITGHSLYQGFSFNERLSRDEFIMPALYATAKKIARAQELALIEGNTLVIYETFRPVSVQIQVGQNLQHLSATNEIVYRGLNQAPWSMGWFIASGLSSHQWGSAVDLSLANVNAREEESVGNYSIIRVVDYTEYIMPTPIHELSYRAAVFATPVSPSDRYAWQNVGLASTMNIPAVILQRYLTQAGFTPLASEWWHFEDLDATERVRGNTSQGDFVLSRVYSRVPE